MRSRDIARKITANERRLFGAIDDRQAPYADILDSIADPITFIGPDFSLKLANRAARKLMGGEMRNPLICYRCLHGRQNPCHGHEEEGPCPFLAVQHTGRPFSTIHRHSTPDGGTRYDEILASPLLDREGSFLGVVEILRDVTERRKMEEERERLITRLQDAIEHIKTLHGLLPMCAWCNKIKDDKGRWKKVEEYMEEHTDAKFTHGICPDCLKKARREQRSKNSRSKE